MAGTLERVVKYDAVAFQKAWGFLASSDDEDNYFLFLFFRRIIFPGKGAKYGLFWGDCFFCSRWPMPGNELRKKRKKKFHLKKRQRFRKNHRRGHRTRARARINITPQTYGTDEVVVVVVFLTLTDPLRIQPWSQDRRNQTKSNRESEVSRESRQKRANKKVASKGHRRDKIENTKKKNRQ